MEAAGAALARRFAGRVDLRETRHLTHDGSRLEDTLVSGNVATTNVSEVDAWTEVVNADGSTMRVRARWDGDVWVETDDCALMETRRWMERGTMVVARTVADETGKLITSKQYFRRYVKAATDFSSWKLIEAPNATPQALPAVDEKQKDDDEVSIFADPVGFGSKMLSGVFGGSPKEEHAKGADILKLFKLPANTELLTSYECSLITPTSLPPALAAKGDKGTLYVLKYAFAFVGDDRKTNVTWFTEALAVQELTVEGVNSIAMETADGSKIKLHNVKNRDAAFDSMISMLESMPDAEAPTPAMDSSSNGPPLKFGFDPEAHIILQLIDVTVEGNAAKTPGTPVTTVILGETNRSLNSTTPVPTGFGGYSANIGKTVTLSMASLNEFDGEHVTFLVRDARGEEIGEAMLPVAALPRDEEGCANVRGAPFALNLSLPRSKVEAGATGLRTKPVPKNAARGVGSINVAAWISSASEAIGLGVKSDLQNGVVAKTATVRVTPTLCAITIVARSVRGLPPMEMEPIRCVMTYGSQQAETSEANFSMNDDVKFSFGEASFNTEAPCTGVLRVDVVASRTQRVLATTTLDVSELPKRRTNRQGEVSAPPSGRYHKLQSADEIDDNDDAGFVFLQAYVDPAMTYSQQQKPLLGELSVKVLKLAGLPEGCAPALIANVGSAWALLPGFGGGGPSGWKRELQAAVRDAADSCTILIYNRSKPEEIYGKLKFSPFSLPGHGRAIVSTVPLTTRDVFGSGKDYGEVTIRLQFKQHVSNTALFVHYCTPILPPGAYRYGDMNALLRDLDMVNYEQLVTGQNALPEPLVRNILDVSESDPSIATTRRSKATAIRLAVSLECFGDVLKPLAQAVTWEKPLYTALLHVSIIACLWIPRLTFIGYFAFIGWHISLKNSPRSFTLLGENKSRLVGSVDVTRAPPGTTLSPLSSLVRESQRVPARTSPSYDAYDAVVQISFWCQAQLEYAREYLEKFHAIITWDDEGDSAKFQILLWGATVGFLFIPFRFIAAAVLFVCLRHPWVMKSPLPPYKVAIARAITPAPAA